MDLVKYRTTIEGKHITLRILEPEDASGRYADWLNDPVVNKYLETRQATVLDLEQYITEKLTSPAALFFGIFGKETGEHIGNVKLEPVDFAQGYATMGILIGDKSYWGRGIATEVTNLIVHFAFATLGLREVNLGVITENKAAIRVYEKCGFTVERVEKRAKNHDGVWYDQVWMRRLNPKSQIRNPKEAPN